MQIAELQPVMVVVEAEGAVGTDMDREAQPLSPGLQGGKAASRGPRGGRRDGPYLIADTCSCTCASLLGCLASCGARRLGAPEVDALRAREQPARRCCFLFLQYCRTWYDP